MSQSRYDSYSGKNNEGEFREILDGYLKHWQWFLGTTVLAIILALLYLRNTTPIYHSVSTIVINDEESNSSSTKEPLGFSGLGLLNGMGTNSIENELGILRSKRLMANAVKTLGINIRYFDGDGFQAKEVYNETPYFITAVHIDEDKLQAVKKNDGHIFEIEQLDDNNLKVTNLNTEVGKTINSGDLLKLEFGDFLIQKNEIDPIPLEPIEKLLVHFEPLTSVVQSYQSKLQIELVDENATLIELHLEDAVKEKGEDILNQIVLEYNLEAIQDKNLIAENTAFFIDERLRIINKELDSVETGKEAFKEANSLSNIEIESSLIVQSASEYNVKQQEVGMQLELVQEMIKFLQSDKSEPLPANMGIGETGVDQLVNDYNNLIIERNRALLGSSARHPLVVRLDGQIKELKSSLLIGFERIRSSLRISRNNLRRQANLIGSQISNVPGQEREFRGIERQQNVKEALYLFLLQKREENSLSLAATAPKAKLVDQAYTLEMPVSPNSKIILFVALLFGVITPFSYINLKKLLNNKVQNKEDLKRLTKGGTVVGELPHLSGVGGIVDQDGNRSVLSEAFHVLLSNMQFLIQKNRDVIDGRCIFVTSSVKGEGKTFTTFNLAMTLVNSGHKVLVIDADLRAPQIQRYEKSANRLPGLSNYLAQDDHSLDDLIINSTLQPKLKLLLSGNIPPNPSELLRQDKLDEMFAILRKKFDYIVVDTPPAMLLADTFLMNKKADLTLFVVRAGFTYKKLLEFSVDAKEEGKVKNLSYVLNDIKLDQIGYGNMYGYGYELSNQNRFSRLWSSFSGTQKQG